ncbi:MAG TPA: four helix bundle protein [Candidatus Aquilonibacter sp.]|nr:four helix bundle protein [Candidatus Aquilonibacter sp.]
MSTEAGRKASITSYRDLIVWQKAMDLVAKSYELTKYLPPGETYGLAMQIQRAAVSIPANIAEGYGRHHLGDYLHHVSVANGSLKELETHFLIAVRLEYLGKDRCEQIMKLTDEIGRMLAALAQGLRKRLPNAKSDGRT